MGERSKIHQSVRFLIPHIYITSVSVESKTLRRNLKHRFSSNGVFHMNAFFSKTSDGRTVENTSICSVSIPHIYITSVSVESKTLRRNLKHRFFSNGVFFTWTHFFQKLVMGERSKIHQSVRFLIPHIYITSVSVESKTLRRNLKHRFSPTEYFTWTHFFSKTSDGRTVENTSICSVSDTAYIHHIGVCWIEDTSVEIWNIGFSPKEYFTWTHFSQKLVMGERSKIHQSVRFLIPHIYITSVSVESKTLRRNLKHRFFSNGVFHMNAFFSKTSDGRTVENTSICSVSIYITSNRRPHIYIFHIGRTSICSVSESNTSVLLNRRHFGEIWNIGFSPTEYFTWTHFLKN